MEHQSAITALDVFRDALIRAAFSVSGSKKKTFDSVELEATLRPPYANDVIDFVRGSEDTGPVLGRRGGAGDLGSRRCDRRNNPHFHATMIMFLKHANGLTAPNKPNAASAIPSRMTTPSAIEFAIGWVAVGWVAVAMALTLGSIEVTAQKPEALQTPEALQGSKGPNVLVVLTDDQGWGDLSLHGNPNLSTPNIDSLARDGARLKNFYVCAVCSPTRAEFLTGRYHTRMGVYSTSSGGERFDSAERTIGDVFVDAGYATAAYGKWHSGMQAPYHPNSRGFEDFYGFCSGHWGNYFSPMLEHNGRLVQGDGFIIDDLTDHAIDFMTKPRQRPFFVYLPLNTPHSPMQVPDDDWQEFADRPITADPMPANAKQEDVVHTRAALALCKNIDDNVGRLLSTIDQLGIREETIVVFFCDNGPNGSRFNGGLRGRKGSVYEGGLRSPGLIRWPGHIPAGNVVDSISGAIDWLPTLADLCQVEIGQPAGPLDGISMAGHLLSKSSATPHANDRLIFTAWNTKMSVRSQRFRYHPDGTLYEIDSDFGEQHDVADQYPAEAERLKKALTRWREQTPSRPVKSETERPFPVGHPDSDWTQLPARDANATGQIRRSNKFPNSSYFTQWVNTDDAILWDIDVIEPGTFEVLMRYTCPESAIGTTLRLESFRPSGEVAHTTDATVRAAGDTSVVGKQYDRSPRTEGYDKNWIEMDLGTIGLSSGRQTLRLTCPSIAGDSGIEMRLIMLQRTAQAGGN